MNRLFLALTAMMLCGGGGCATVNTIPGTKVADTKSNREILDVCERYRHAMEDRDATTLLALAHPNYYEDSGTPRRATTTGTRGSRKSCRSA